MTSAVVHPRRPLEQSARGRLEAAERALLDPVGDRAPQQIFADAGGGSVP